LIAFPMLRHYRPRSVRNGQEWTGIIERTGIVQNEAKRLREGAAQAPGSAVPSLQEWVREKKLRVIVLFEGRDAAGKGGTIKAITERVSPRVFRVVALPAPLEREKTQMFMQRYMRHFPSGGKSSSSTAAGTTAPVWNM
jgi:polyphosphate kinase 2 (PPK2 family)